MSGQQELAVIGRQSIDLLRGRSASDPAKTEHTAFDIHSKILTPYPSHLEAHDDLRLRLEDVGRRLPPIPSQAVGKLAVEFDEGMGAIALRNRHSPA